MPYQDVIFEKQEGVASLTLNWPEKLNALSPGIRSSLLMAADEVSRDDDVKVLIITGAGRAFCAGADVRALDTGTIQSGEEGRKGIMGPLSLPILRLAELEKPTIAAVNGIAAGGGFGLALVCDIRIASENARFCSVFVRRGLPAEWGVSYYLPRIVGTATALRLMWTGNIIDAREAQRIGLVSEVVPANDLMPTTKELAYRLARGPSVAIELIKRIVYGGLSNDLATQLGYETYAAGVCGRTEDLKEGVRSFLEKREPKFEGR